MQKLKDTFAGFWKYRYLLQNLISRDFKLKYRRSVLGVAWSVLNPLLTCLVMWAVFGALFNQRGQGIEDFPLSAFSSRSSACMVYCRPSSILLTGLKTASRSL